MKIPKSCQVEKAISTDAHRTCIQHAYLSGNTLTATNAIVMARIPVERDVHDADGYVSKEALKAARKAAGRLNYPAIQANGALTLPNGQSFPRPQEGDGFSKWPNCDQVWNPVWGRPVKFKIAFSTEQLADLAAAMGTEGVTLEITAETDPIRVLPCNTRKVKSSHIGSKGIIMPIRTA